MCKGLHVPSDKLKPCHVEYFRDRINREKTMNQLGFCGLMDESENDFNAVIHISEQKYQDHALQANTKEVVCFNDRNRDAKICFTLKLMKIIGLKKGPIDYDTVLEKERMMKCLHNSINFFNNETMKSLILVYILQRKG